MPRFPGVDLGLCEHSEVCRWSMLAVCSRIELAVRLSCARVSVKQLRRVTADEVRVPIGIYRASWQRDHLPPSSTSDMVNDFWSSMCFRRGNGGLCPASQRSIDHFRPSRPRPRENKVQEDFPDRKVEVYLPPMYGLCRCKFPVIYLLHGYKGSADQWTSDPDWNIQGEMDKAIAGGLKPLIIVMPDAKTRAGGSFYVNSSADGQWEDFIVKELVGAIDQRFDTLAMPEARAIAGHSMGGYGALYIAFRHPDVFSAIYALSPCCLEIAGDLLPSNPEWFVSERFLSFDVFKQEDHYVAQAFEGMAIAWSPQAGEKPFGASLPVRLQGTKQVFDPSIRALWNAHMIVPTVSAEIANLRRLRAIGFDAGRQDPFTHIPLGESDLDHILQI